jgi:hypothetical protein
MNEFTKGPWVVITEDDDWGCGSDQILIGMASYNEDYMQSYCCHRVIIEDADNEALANANLIAAAPEMYAMIEMLANELKSTITTLNYNIKRHSGNDNDLWDQESLHLAQLLLKKARGE